MLVPLRGPSSVAEWRPARTADVPLCRRPVIHAEHPESGFDWKACSLICDKYSFLGLLHSIVVLLRINVNLCGQLQDAVDTWHLEDWGRFSILLCTLFFQSETEWWSNPIIETYLTTHWVCFFWAFPFFSQRNVPKAFLLECLQVWNADRTKLVFLSAKYTMCANLFRRHCRFSAHFLQIM